MPNARLLSALLAVLTCLVMAGCQGPGAQIVDSTHALTQPPLARNMRQQMVALGYDEQTIGQMIQWSAGWKDLWGRPLMPRWQAALAGVKSPEKLTRSQRVVGKQLAHALRRSIAYDSRWFELDDMIAHGRGQCLAYVQAYVILGRSLGLQITPINVIQTDKTMQFPSGQGHIACMLTLSNGLVVQVDVPSNGIISKPFVLEDTYAPDGPYWQRSAQHRQSVFEEIQFLDDSGFMAHLFNSRGAHQAKMGKTDRALEFYMKAIRRNATFAEAYNNRAAAHFKQENWEQARADCEKALSLNPSLAETLNTRGALSFRQGLVDRALADFEQALQIKPHFSKATHNRKIALESRQLQSMSMTTRGTGPRPDVL